MVKAIAAVIQYVTRPATLTRDTRFTCEGLAPAPGAALDPRGVSEIRLAVNTNDVRSERRFRQTMSEPSLPHEDGAAGTETARMSSPSASPSRSRLFVGMEGL